MLSEAAQSPRHSIQTSRYILLLLVAVVMLAGVALSFRFAVDYVLQYRINATLDRWQKSSKAVSVHQWQQMEHEAKMAVAASPDDADLENSLGRLYDFRAMNMQRADERRIFIEKAIRQYKQVIRLRPAWPYGWMNMAVAMARLGSFNDDFMRALIQSVRLGPWERSTLPNLVWLSMMAWSSMHAAERADIGAYLLEAARERSGEVRRELQADGSMDFFCKVIGRDEAGISFCPAAAS